MTNAGLPAILDKMEGQIATALPSGGAPAARRFIRAVKSFVQLNPQAAELDRTSLLGAVMKSAQQGLVLDGKEAAVIPFKGKAVYVPMVAGLIKLMRQHSDFAEMDWGIVYSREIDEGRFKHVKGRDGEFRHEPIYFGDKGQPLGAYAYLKTKDDDFFLSVMDKDQIERRLAKGMQSAMKKEFWEEFWGKTVIRALYKIAPNSGDEAGFLDGVFSDDGEVTDKPEPVAQPPIATPEPEPEKPRQTRAAAAVMAQVEEAEIVPDEYTPPQYEDDEIPM